MTSFVGKWKLLVLLLCCGNLVFAKAELPPSTTHTIFSSLDIATFSINKNTTRSEIFDLFKELFMSHSIKAKLNGYKRHADVITLLDLTLTDDKEKSYPLKLENEKGIDDACLTINVVENRVVEFTTCMEAQKAIVPIVASNVDEVKSILETKSQLKPVPSAVVKGESLLVNKPISSRQQAQQVIATRKSQTELEIKTARLRVKQQQEERRLNILERKAKVEATQESNRIKNEQLTKDRALKREQRLQETRDRQQAKREELEAARIEKLEEEKRQISIETARIESQAQAERDQLEQLEKERLAAQQRQEQRRVDEENAKKEALQLKVNEKERAREVERVRNRLEAERLEKAKAKKELVKQEKFELELKRNEQELELERLAQQRLAAQADLDRQLEKERAIEEKNKRKERERKEKELIDERERYRGKNATTYQRRELMRNANEEVYIPDSEKIIEQGFLIFNAEQCSFKVFIGRTDLYDAFGHKLLTINDELIDAPQNGKVVVNGIEAVYEFTSNMLIIRNLQWQFINEDGKIVGALMNSEKPQSQSFKSTHSFKIKTTFSKEEVKSVLNQIEIYQFDTELLEMDYKENGRLIALVFRIGEESFVFNELDAISYILIDIDENHNRVKVIDKKE